MEKCKLGSFLEVCTVFRLIYYLCRPMLNKLEVPVKSSVDDIKSK